MNVFNLQQSGVSDGRITDVATLEEKRKSLTMLIVLASDLLTENSNRVADNFRPPAYFGVISLIFDCCGSTFVSVSLSNCQIRELLT